MKRILTLIGAAVFATSAMAAQAYWTGQMEIVQTVGGGTGVSCEYNYQGQTFWRTFNGSMCPQSVWV